MGGRFHFVIVRDSVDRRHVAVADETYTASAFDLLNVFSAWGKSFHYSVLRIIVCIPKVDFPNCPSQNHTQLSDFLVTVFLSRVPSTDKLDSSPYFGNMLVATGSLNSSFRSGRPQTDKPGFKPDP